MYFTLDPGLTVNVNFIFTLREPSVYKPHGFFLGFLATFICFCVTVLFYRYFYFVVNQIKLQSYILFFLVNILFAVLDCLPSKILLVCDSSYNYPRLKRIMQNFHQKLTYTFFSTQSGSTIAGKAI